LERTIHNFVTIFFSKKTAIYINSTLNLQSVQRQSITYLAIMWYVATDSDMSHQDLMKHYHFKYWSSVGTSFQLKMN